MDISLKDDIPDNLETADCVPNIIDKHYNHKCYARSGEYTNAALLLFHRNKW